MGVRTIKTENNDFVFANNRLTQLTGINALAQILENRLKLWLGEWFVAEDSGIDYFGLLDQGKNVPIEKRARIIYRQALLADPRITKIKSMTINFDNASRTINIDFVVIANEEELSASITLP